MMRYCMDHALQWFCLICSYAVTKHLLKLTKGAPLQSTVSSRENIWAQEVYFVPTCKQPGKYVSVECRMLLGPLPTEYYGDKHHIAHSNEHWQNTQ